MPLLVPSAVGFDAGSLNGSDPGVRANMSRYEDVSIATITGVTSQRLQVYTMPLPAGFTVTSIAFTSGNTAMSVGVNQWFNLVDPDTRALLAITADDTATAWGGNTRKALNLASPYTTTEAKMFWVGLMVNATVVPSLAGAAIPLGNVPRSHTPVSAGAADTGLTNPASCPSTIAVPTILSTAPYIEVF